LPSDLLVESRRGLADELDRIERKRSWWRMPAFSVVFTPMRLLESATLVAMGLALGVYVSTRTPAASPAVDSASAISIIPQDGTVSNLRIVTADATGKVEFFGNISQPLRFEGQMNDERTLQLLSSALQDVSNTGSRLQALEVLSKRSNDASVKELLTWVLVNDENPGVRLKAMEGLKAFAGEENVRAAFMQALRDPNSGIRVGAIEALTPFIDNDAMVSRIQEVTKNDDNSYVRMQGQGLQLVGNKR
jgi:HEAT repeat protein